MAEMLETESKKSTMRLALLIFNIMILAIGTCAGPLVMRLYFLHGGKRIWFSSWLQTAAWPVILIPITISYFNRRRSTDLSSLSSQPSKFFLMKPRLFFAAAVFGTLTGLDDYLYAYGVARLPVSTSSLIIASQLAFTAAFAFFLVKQKFTSYTVNAVFLLTIGAVVLALHSNSDRPNNESTRQYVLGFLMTLGAAMLYGLILPMIELTYKKAKQEISYALVLEIQMVMCLFATLFCTVGMVINKDFQVSLSLIIFLFIFPAILDSISTQCKRVLKTTIIFHDVFNYGDQFMAIGREAKEYTLGEAKYYVAVVANAIVWQCFFLGAIGVVFCGSSLLSAIIVSVLLPATEILAVIFYKEKFQAEKGVSLALSLWGFASYFYGEIKHEKKKKKKETQISETEMPQQIPIP